MKHFEIELKDIYPEKDHWVPASVFYEDDYVYEIEDEFGIIWPLAQLSKHDQDLVTKALIQEVMANNAEMADRWCEV